MLELLLLRIVAVVVAVPVPVLVPAVISDLLLGEQDEVATVVLYGPTIVVELHGIALVRVMIAFTEMVGVNAFS